ncbi:MAG: citrate lyase acyl carrier protein [Spirochaetes bacterium]|nr:citrate lyase acyl carrier protein [Spirochaetota bacterium]
MELKKTAMAGTLESGDVQVKLAPGQGGMSVTVDSVVINQYGRRIKEVAKETLAALGVASAELSLVDKGALDCTIRARVECAAYRAAEVQAVAWKGGA